MRIPATIRPDRKAESSSMWSRPSAPSWAVGKLALAARIALKMRRIGKRASNSVLRYDVCVYLREHRGLRQGPVAILPRIPDGATPERRGKGALIGDDHSLLCDYSVCEGTFVVPHAFQCSARHARACALARSRRTEPYVRSPLHMHKRADRLLASAAMGRASSTWPRRPWVPRILYSSTNLCGDPCFWARSTYSPPVLVCDAESIGNEEAKIYEPTSYRETPPAMEQPWLLYLDSPERGDDCIWTWGLTLHASKFGARNSLHSRR